LIAEPERFDGDGSNVVSESDDFGKYRPQREIVAGPRVRVCFSRFWRGVNHRDEARSSVMRLLLRDLDPVTEVTEQDLVSFDEV